ncbi:MAG: 5-(carboxyamino)imidazole ribonucleotide synthase, partial [Dermatophilaceae bacterium]
MIGAGQLARMTHQAAVDLDIELRVLAESPDDSAVVGGAPYRLGSAASLVDLEGAAAGADVVTFDH